MNPDVYVSRKKNDKLIPTFSSYNVKGKYRKKKEKAIEKPELDLTMNEIKNKALAEKLEKVKSMSTEEFLKDFEKWSE